MPKNLLDLAIRRQVTLERLKAGHVRDFNTVFKDVAFAVRSQLSKLEADGSTVSRRTVNRWVKNTEAKVRKLYTDRLKMFIPELEKTGGIYAAMEANDIMASMFDPVNVRSASPRDAFRLAKRVPMPFSGEKLEDFVGKLAGNETDRVVNTVRKGFFQGRTNQQIVRDVIGSKAANYKDGILEVSRRNASTTVRTSIQHAANAGRNATWEANKDIVAKYEWVSTLDGRTSHQCKGLDGQAWEVGKGPTPPIHPNCRSTTVAVLSDKYKFLSEGRTRSSLDGPIPAEDSYFDWLKRQDSDFQDLALGRDRAKLFRDGGLTPERFRALQLNKNFQPMTLVEMKKLEPDAFNRAFGGTKVTPVVPTPKPKVTPVTPVTPVVPTPKPKVDPNVVVPSQRVKDVRKKVASLFDADEASKVRKLTNEREAALEEYGKYKNKKGKKAVAAGDAFWDAQFQIDGYYRDAKAEAHKLLSLPKTQRVSPPSIYKGGIPTGVTQAVNDGSIFVSKFVKATIAPQGVLVEEISDYRAFYTNHNKTINLHKNTKPSVVAHEFAHNIEYNHPDIAAKTEAFLRKRGGGADPVFMGDVASGKFDPWEFTLEDSWAKNGGSAYTGKIYKGRPSSEILTTGVERLVDDPVLFAREDPEFFEFVLSIFQD